MPNASDTIAYAKTQLGEHENPVGSNLTKYGAEYGMNPASWCAELVTGDVWRHSGLPIPADAQSPLGWASVGLFLASARKAGWVVTDPRPGDFACFEWERDSWPDHVGIVVDVFADGSLYTIEGNARDVVGVPGNEGLDPANGDQVAFHIRPRSQVLAFVRPPYDGASVPASNSTPAIVQPRNIVPYLRLSNGVLLSKGSGHHDLVAIYQRRMIQRGWDLGPSGADGVFGDRTYAATIAFQKEKGLNVDGVVGPQTWTCAFECPVT